MRPGPGESARDVLVPLDRLVLSEANVRKVVNEEGIAELAALIESQGLLQRLCVVAQPDGRFAVVAGGRRLRAMQLLAAEGRWSASQPVECKLYDERAPSRCRWPRTPGAKPCIRPTRWKPSASWSRKGSRSRRWRAASA